jgi:hypothetical protein
VRRKSQLLLSIRIGHFHECCYPPPRYQGAEVVVSAPESGPGNWAGGASCVKHPRPAAVARRNHPARRAAGFDSIRLHPHDQPAVSIIFNVEHVQTGNIKDRVGSAASVRNRTT